MDLTKYLWLDGSAVTKTDRKGDTVLLDFALVPYDTAFVKLHRGAYITVDSATYPKWFTGFITNEPDLKIIGSKNGVPVWGYIYHASADDYRLSLNPLGLVRPFFNVPMGTILKTLITRLSGTAFDVTGVMDGPLVAQYYIDPTKSFFDVQKDLCDAASYVFYGNDMKLFFKPQDHGTFRSTILDGNNRNFTPAALDITVDTTPLINDVTVVGDIEPQRYVQEYFLGTGLESSFQLIDSVFGADSSLLIDEMFSGSTIDTSKWVVFDHVNQFLQLNNGYLNSLGGSGDQSYDVSIQSISSIPMEGHLRFTHGEWDFLGGGGVIGSLWVQAPNSLFAGCLYGIVSNGGTLHPIANGTGDGSQTMTVSTTKRYVIRTIASFSKMNRTSQPYSYIDATGAIHSVALASSGADTVTWQTTITEIDPITGLVTASTVWSNTCALTGTNDTYATYVPLISDSLHATVTGITVSTPLSASLATSETVPMLNSDFDLWADGVYASGWTGESASGVSETTTHVAEGSALQLINFGTDIPYVAQFVPAGSMKVGTSYNVRALLRKDGTLFAGNLKITISGTGVAETGLTIPVSAISQDEFTSFSGVLIAPLNAVPSDLAIKVYLDSATTLAACYVDELAITTAWQLQLVGPNEIDAIDGQAPVATIIQPNGGSTTTSTYTGAPQYNSGQGQLVFFKDSVTRTSNIPPVGQLVRLSYRSAGAALGRVSNLASVATEASAWGDNGVRSVVRSDLTPRPRSAAECELAASALVAENSYTHYKGTYVQRSEFLANEPRGGSILKFMNLSNMADVQAEEINEVVTTLDNRTPESFIHTITFGRPDHIQILLDAIQKPVGAFQVNTDASSPAFIDVSAVGLNYAGDVTQPNILSWDNSLIYMDTGQSLPTGGVGFEVRYTDDSWGADDGRNLVTRTTSRLFSVPRSLRGQIFFIRQVAPGNLLTFSEDQTNSQYTATGVAVTRPMSTNMSGNLSQVAKLVFSGAGSLTTACPTTSAGACFSLDVKGVVGHSVTVSLGSTTRTVVLSGNWQRVSVSALTSGTLSLASTTAQTVQTSRWSVEQGTVTERSYSKTNATPYGPLSRYSAAVHVAFPAPLIPIPTLPTIIRVTTDSTLVAPADGTDLIVEMDTIAGAITVTLPPTGSFVGQTISCVLVTLGSADSGGVHDATVNAGSGDTYSGASSWVFSKQWTGQEFSGTA
jgi:hypothetical protein